MRFALNLRERPLGEVSWTEEVCKNIGVSFPRPEVLSFVLNSNVRTVSFIRYKKTDKYHIEGMPQYKVDIITVKEYKVKGVPKGEAHEVTVYFERFRKCHMEVQVRSYKLPTA